MITTGEVLALISHIESSVWNLLTITITVNLAIVGWLIHRHGLYGVKEKVIAFVGYTGFLCSIVFGIQNAYSKLDLAANDLAHIYIENQNNTKRTIANSGLFASYISRSPSHCGELKESLEFEECSKYSNYMNINLIFIFVGWLFISVLFLYDGLWKKGRENA